MKAVGQPWLQLTLAAMLTAALRRRHVRGANAVVTSVAIAFFGDRVIKKLVGRHRPPGYVGHTQTESFPSGHTAATAALTLTVARLLEDEGIVPSPYATLTAALITAGVAETRLILGEHWVSDVVAGAFLGAVASKVALGAIATSAPRARRSRGMLQWSSPDYR